MEIWEPKPPGTLWATPGLLRDCFTFFLYIFYDLHMVLVCEYAGTCSTLDGKNVVQIHLRLTDCPSNRLFTGASQRDSFTLSFLYLLLTVWRFTWRGVSPSSVSLVL